MNASQTDWRHWLGAALLIALLAYGLYRLSFGRDAARPTVPAPRGAQAQPTAPN